MHCQLGTHSWGTLPPCTLEPYPGHLRSHGSFSRRTFCATRTCMQEMERAGCEKCAGPGARVCMAARRLAVFGRCVCGRGPTAAFRLQWSAATAPAALLHRPRMMLHPSVLRRCRCSWLLTGRLSWCAPSAEASCSEPSAALPCEARLLFDGGFACGFVPPPVAGHAGGAAVEDLVAAAALAEAAAPHRAAWWGR